jgi:hypothetical protein
MSSLFDSSLSQNCEYTSSSGTLCKHTKLYNSDYCHLKSHYPSKDNYEKVIQLQHDFFENNTYNFTNKFFYNPPMNGSCMYYCFINYIMNNPNVFNNTNNPFYELIHKYIQIEWNKIDRDIQYEKNVESVQQLLKDYIIQNQNKYPENFDIPWNILVRECHSLSIPEYDLWYSIPASQSDYIDGEPIPTRWGSLVECIAFSEIFGINSKIFLSVRFHQKQLKMVKCAPQLPEARYQLLNEVYYDKMKKFRELNIILFENHYIQLF